MKVLFVGNSFTYYNEMPQLLERIAAGAGKPLTARRITKGGYSLRQYLDPTDPYAQELEEARKERWDYVVLQGQSAEPAIETEQFLRAAAELCKKARAIGATPLFYQTWSYTDGTEKLASVSMGYEEFYLALKAAYQQAAKVGDTVCVPVGDLFFRLTAPVGPLHLICGDDYHPTLAGSYAAAILFYCRLFGPEAEYWRPEEISPEDAALIWKTAAELN